MDKPERSRILLLWEYPWRQMMGVCISGQYTGWLVRRIEGAWVPVQELRGVLGWISQQQTDSTR